MSAWAKGEWLESRTVTLRFVDKATALKWYLSHEYLRLVEIRKSADKANILVIYNTAG